MPPSTATSDGISFGSLLREYRKRARLSQHQLADYLAISPKSVSRWETGLSAPARNPAFFVRLQKVPGLTKADIARLWIVAHSRQTAWHYTPPEEPQGFRAEVLTQTFAEIMTPSAELPVAEIARWFMPVTEDPLLPLEEAQAPSQESFTDTGDDAIISSPMPPKEVEPSDHLTEHISDLQSQAKFGSETKQQPLHYPHENVVFHVAQLQAEALGKQGTKKDSVMSYEIVATLRDAAKRTGVADDEILTTSEIEAEYHINKKLVHEYTRRGRQGRPHLTPLNVRLGGEGGSPQLLFRREDIERLVADPPKGGRPRK